MASGAAEGHDARLRFVTAERSLMRVSRTGVATVVVLWGLVVAVAPHAGAQPSSGQTTALDRAQWQAIIKNNYTPPPGATAAQLAPQLSRMLGSPDPELRDEIAYDVLSTWIYQSRLLAPVDLRPLIAEWTGNLKKDIGSAGTDSVELRSFSALTLSVVIARDNDAPFLTEVEFRSLLASALAYAQAERDFRGYDAQKGWLHSSAHTADLLKFLARSRYITPADQAAILSAVQHKLRDSNTVFTFGEDERLARTVLSIINRKDFDMPGFRQWLVIIRPEPPISALPEVSLLNANQNVKNMLAKLEVILIAVPNPLPQVTEALASVQGTLKGAF
jgi:hypothetical protein